MNISKIKLFEFKNGEVIVARNKEEAEKCFEEIGYNSREITCKEIVNLGNNGFWIETNLEDIIEKIRVINEDQEISVLKSDNKYYVWMSYVEALFLDLEDVSEDEFEAYSIASNF